MSSQDDAFHTLGRFVSVGGFRIFTVDHGEGSPVVLLHGIPTSSYLWRDVIPVLALEHRAIAPDLVGFGYSDKPRHWTYSVTSQADIVAGLLDRLGVERFALAGHDLGALVAAELITRMPERVTHLILTNTSLRHASWSRPTPLWLLRVPVLGEVAVGLARRWMLKLAMRMYVSRKHRLTSEVMRRYWQPWEHGFRQVLLQFYRQPPMTADDMERWRAELARFDRPCLIVWGARDPSFGAADAADLTALIPGSKLEVFEHANHFIQEDRPLALGRLMNVFLAGHDVPDARRTRKRA